MFPNYLKTALRSLRKQKLFSLINLFGLAVGITVTILILLYVQAELSYDDSQENREQVYRVLRQASLNGNEYLIGITSGPFAAALQTDFPETIHEAVRVLPNDGLVTYQNHSFMENKFYLADGNFFEVFSFPFRRGDPATALTQPNSVVLTAAMARKYFGDDDPIGKTLLLDEQYQFTVTGVLADNIGRSHLDFDFMASIEFMNRFDWFSDWWNNMLFTYVRIESPAAAQQLESQLPGFMDKYFGDDFARNGTRVDLTLQPLGDIYFQNEVRYDYARHGDEKAVYIFFAIAVFILLIACINYMNLTTARASRRGREIGVRKVLGAHRGKLILQFLAESFLMTLAAIVLAMAAVELLLPFFNAAFRLDLAIDFTRPQSLAFLGGILLLVSLLAGSYPAFLLSSFQPVKVLKSRRDREAHDVLIRKGLVIFQFCISVFLIIATLLVGQQLDYLRSKDLGFDESQVVLVPLNNQEIRDQQETFKERLRNEPGVVNASVMSGQPGGFHDTMSFDLAGRDDNFRFRTVYTDYDYVQTLGIELAAGRNFSRDFGSDDHAVLLNETAVRALGWSNEEAVGKTLHNTMFDTTESEIVGVVRDFHFSSLKDRIEPLLIGIRPWGRMMAVKVQSADMAGALAAIEAQWNNISPAYPCTYTFLDETFQQLYRQEQRESVLFKIFAVISILIACLGIFALASFAAEERTREIGIRKVLGATIPGLVRLLSRDFVKLVALGNLLAWPLAWLAMNRWLGDFAYRIEIGWGVFVLAGALALLIALLTVSWQAIRAALANPVKALRYE